MKLFSHAPVPGPPVAPKNEAVTALNAAAEMKIEAFEKCVAAAFAAEQEIFGLLFGQERGLRQPFPGGLSTDARIARHKLGRRMIAISEKYGWQLNPQFQTDGEVFLGDEASHVRRTVHYETR